MARKQTMNQTYGRTKYRKTQNQEHTDNTEITNQQTHADTTHNTTHNTQHKHNTQQT